MAQLYVPYALGSMAFAAVSKWLYDYSNGAEGEITGEDVIELNCNEEIPLPKPEITVEEPVTEVTVEPVTGVTEEPVTGVTEEPVTGVTEEPVTEDLYECTKCHNKKTLNDFSKNQQKKKPLNMWKCKTCTGK